MPQPNTNIVDELRNELYRADGIIRRLTAQREAVLCRGVSASLIQMILAEEEEIDPTYLAVKIAEALDKNIARIYEV